MTNHPRHPSLLSSINQNEQRESWQKTSREMKTLFSKYVCDEWGLGDLHAQFTLLRLARKNRNKVKHMHDTELQKPFRRVGLFLRCYTEVSCYSCLVYVAIHFLHCNHCYKTRHGRVHHILPRSASERSASGWICNGNRQLSVSQMQALHVRKNRRHWQTQNTLLKS